MDTRQRIMHVLYDAVGEFNQQLPENQQLPLTPDTVLLAEASRLDSLGLVNLIMLAEERLSDEFQTPLTLADDRAMSQKRSPFRSLTTLADYVALLLEERQTHE